MLSVFAAVEGGGREGVGWVRGWVGGWVGGGMERTRVYVSIMSRPVRLKKVDPEPPAPACDFYVICALYATGAPTHFMCLSDMSPATLTPMVLDMYEGLG